MPCDGWEEYKNKSAKEPDPCVKTYDPDFDALLSKCVDILKVKGEDYRIGSEDKLANFKEVARFFGCSPKLVLGVYMYKHFAAIFNYIKTDGKSESEPIDGRLADAINYCLLLSKMIKEEEKK